MHFGSVLSQAHRKHNTIDIRHHYLVTKLTSVSTRCLVGLSIILAWRTWSLSPMQTRECTIYAGITQDGLNCGKTRRLSPLIRKKARYAVNIITSHLQILQSIAHVHHHNKIIHHIIMQMLLATLRSACESKNTELACTALTSLSALIQENYADVPFDFIAPVW